MDVGEIAFVFGAALVTALATGLGALPFAFFQIEGGRLLGIANAVAAGVMLGASVVLVLQGAEGSLMLTAIGLILGGALAYGVRKLLTNVGSPGIAGLSGASARSALLIISVMTAQSAGEGFGVGSSFGGGETFGVLIAIAMAIHNIPEGLAISLVLVPKGTRVVSAAGWSIFSSLPQPVLAIPSFVFVEAFRSMLPAALGFAAGAMIWVTIQELLRDAFEQASKGVVAGFGTVGFAAMFAFQFLLLG